MAGRYKPQENYAVRMLALGHVKVSGWVPESDREEFLQIAKDMRSGHEAKPQGEEQLSLPSV